MKIERYIVGIFQTNTYLLSIDNKCILIDPAAKAEKLIEILGEKELIAILLTHGHFDHIKAVDALYKKYKCPVYISKDDEVLSRDKSQGETFSIPIASSIGVPETFLKEGMMQIGPFKLEVIFTPGHTKGSVCYRFDNDLFTGDTLFRNSAGRTDLFSGSDRELKSSLRILKDINDNVNIYPGHDEPSTLDEEKINNPYLMYI